MIQWHKTPKLVQRMFPKRIWTFPKESDTVFLSFDDGPISTITPWVIRELKRYDAKATFFCIGENIQKYPAIFKTLISEGHGIGNHTFNHLNGWKTKVSDYVKNVALSETEANKWREDKSVNTPQLRSNTNPSLFRPPYGKMTGKQANILQEKGFKIIMWDILSEDYNTSVSEEECLQNVLTNIAPGSIVVFHDSLKAEKNLRYALPKVLDFISKKGWKCKKM